MSAIIKIIAISSAIFIGKTSAAQGNFQCVSCYTPQLQYEWQITGFPKKPDQGTGVTCNTPGTVPESALVTCSSLCVTFVTEDPDSPSTYYSVRGCWDQLTQSDPNWKSIIQKMSGKCQKSTQKMYNKDNKAVNVKQYYKTCETDKCNLVDVNNIVSGCTDVTETTQVTCYECTEDDSDSCEEGRCTGYYCGYQLTTTNDDREFISKSCTDFNPFGADTCRTYWMTEYDPSRAMKGAVPTHKEITTCYCRDEYYCNSAPRLQIATVVTALFPVVLAKILV